MLSADDVAGASARLHVGNLPPGATEEAVGAALARRTAGIQSFSLQTDDRQLSRGFGFAQFRSPRAAQAAIAALNAGLVAGEAPAPGAAQPLALGGRRLAFELCEDIAENKRAAAIAALLRVPRDLHRDADTAMSAGGAWSGTAAQEAAAAAAPAAGTGGFVGRKASAAEVERRALAMETASEFSRAKVARRVAARETQTMADAESGAAGGRSPRGGGEDGELEALVKAAALDEDSLRRVLMSKPELARAMVAAISTGGT